ncbi:MAG TPA: hypothetical protein VKI44_33425 [Acetobacteraceae bacterium]|nr:hypothetical protein [Acetobacteraceae bacterium]
MDADAKKTTLRMIPYGLYVLTAVDGKGTVGAAILEREDLRDNVSYGG